MTLSLRDIIKQGYLSKGHEIWNNYWDKRWIIIKKGWLYNLKAPKDKKGEVLCLAGATLCPSKRKRQFSFTIRVADSNGQPSEGGASAGGGANSSSSNNNNNNNSNNSNPSGNYTELSFAAETEAEMEAWMEAFRACLSN